MDKIRFNDELIAQLTALDAVEKVTPKMICFTPKFKKSAVLESLNGKLTRQIFANAGIDISLFPPKHFQSLLKRWKCKYRQNQATNFENKTKGRAKGWRKTKKQPSQMNAEELRTELALAKATIDFLEKLKGLKPLD